MHHRSVHTKKTIIVSFGILSPALRLSQHFISSNLLIEPMDYEQQSIVSRFLALAHLQKICNRPPAHSPSPGWGHRGGVHGWDAHSREISMSFFWYVYYQPLSKADIPPFSFTRYSSRFFYFFFIADQFVFPHLTYDTEQAHIEKCFDAWAWQFLALLVLVFPVFHILNIHNMIHYHSNLELVLPFLSNYKMMAATVS